MPGEGQVPGQAPPMPGQASALASKGGVSTGGDTSNNQTAPEGELELAPASEGDSRSQAAGEDSTAGKLNFENEPWFAKLPPSLRGAIQAKARGKAPRGYEERLRRYFESVD